MTPYHPRALAGPVQDALAGMPVVVVTGLRQAGKSTFLRREKGLVNRRYVDLDDFAELESARRDPEAFVHRGDPMTIDEAQRCPDLMLAIKREVDHDRRPGRFLLSGSANFALLRNLADSLAGRAVYLVLHPFTRRELGGSRGSAPWVRRLFDAGEPPRSAAAFEVSARDPMIGGLPPVSLGDVRRPEIWFKGYEQTYLERDVRELGRVADLVSFRNLLRLAALRTAQVLKVSELARDAKLNAATTARYLSVLEASYVIRRVEPFLANRASRLIKSPKLHFGDSGLAAHLAGVGAEELDRDENLRGPLLETYVAQNLLGILEAEWPSARLAYWHVQGRHEVDFVIAAGRDNIAIEVKRATRWDERDLAGLKAFIAKTPRCRAAVLAHGGDATVRLGDRLYAAPVGAVIS